MGGEWISRSDFGYVGDVCVITLAPKSEIRHQFRAEIDNRLPNSKSVLRPRGRCLRFARNPSRFACEDTLRRLQKLPAACAAAPGLSSGSMLSAMHASVEFIWV